MVWCLGGGKKKCDKFFLFFGISIVFACNIDCIV